jgi:hypothetical protein
MRFRKLRIAWSVACVVACVLLIALWVRSYWHADQIYGHTAPTKVLHFGSMGGQLTFRYIKHYNGSGIVKNWMPDGEPVSDITKRRDQSFPNGQDDLLIYRYHSRFNFGWLQDGFYIPHWTLALLAGLLAPIPWLRYRFSLRTLLIATTLVAVALGLIVWLNRRA